MATLTDSERILANKISGLARFINLGDKLNIQVYASAASVGGAATEALTVTGLGASDTILAVTQSTKGAQNLPLLGWSTQVANGLTAVWSATPGAGAIIQVLVLKAPVTT